MSGKASVYLLTVSRVLWVIPVSLVLLAANQLKVGFDLRQTLVEGESAVAAVTAFDRVDRADITYGYVSLRISMEDGSVLTRDEMPLPYSLLHRIEGLDSLDVLVLRGAAQEVIIELVAAAQWRLALIQSAMAFVAAMMAMAGLLAWGRHLRRQGDPATRDPQRAGTDRRSAV